MIAASALTGAAMTPASARAQLQIPLTAQKLGRPIPSASYAVPAARDARVRRRRTDVFVNRQHWSDWSMTPLQDQHGIVTPNGLIFERHHAGVPDIDPAAHRLVIHGMVKQPLEFTMDALMRYPSVSRFNFLECS